jgi:formylglycine-generating enzyme required for sulfatase activity
MIRKPRTWLAALTTAVLLPAADLSAQEAKTPAEMKPYTETIPGTDIKFEMIPVPGGKFVIGSPDGEEGRKDDEGPQREIEIGPYWIGKCEVTWDEYDPFAFSLDIKKKQRDGVDLNAQPETEKKADAVTRPTPPYADETFGLGRKGQPVICITHHAAMEYTRWLSEKTGRLYRLPTEAEWEYAARANTKTAYSFGDDASKLGDYAWFFENCEGPQKVGKKKPNPWGIHDMHGNVSEWVLDHYVADQYAKYPADAAAVKPVVLPDDKEYPYAARGGSWDNDAPELRSAARLSSDKEWSVQDPNRPQSIWWHTDATFVGFRVIRPFEEQPDLVGLKSKVIKKKGTK